MNTIFHLGIIIFLFSIQLTQVAQATTYYVSPSGSDSVSGTSSSTPWQTISKVGSKAYNPGDQILFQGGQTFYGNLWIGSYSAGTSANPITISSYGSGTATLNSGSLSGIQLIDTAGFSISNLILVGNWNAGTQSGNSGPGIDIETTLGNSKKLDSITLNNLQISGYYNSGIYITSAGAPIATSGSKTGYTNVHITGCKVHDNGVAGIRSLGHFSQTSTTYAHSNWIIQNCTIYNNQGITTNTGHTGDGITLGDLNGGLIEGCTSYLNGNLCKGSGGPCGIWVWDSNAVIMQFNESYSNKTANLDGDGFDLDGGVTNCIQQYNYAHDNDGAGFLIYQDASWARPSQSGNIIRYNICENNGRAHYYIQYAGIHFSGDTTLQNDLVYNNTVYSSTTVTGLKPYPFFASGAEGIGNKVYNNIFITTGGIPLVSSSASASNMLFQGNDYWSSGSTFSILAGKLNYSSLSAWRTAQSQEINGLVKTGLSVDPILTSPGAGGTCYPSGLSTLSAYNLKYNSPCINSALNLTANPISLNIGTQDFGGNNLPCGYGYDIGACEYNIPPVIVTSASGTYIAATGTACNLSVFGSDVGGASNLTYNWSTQGIVPTPVTFNTNQTNAAKSVVATTLASGTYSFTATITDPIGLSATSTIQVIVPMNYNLWAIQNGLIGSAGIPTAISDATGINNLTEYALGIVHGSMNLSSLPTAIFSNGKLSINYRSVQSDIIYQPVWSTDLLTWSSTGIIITTSGSNTIAFIPVDSKFRMFMRLRLTK